MALMCAGRGPRQRGETPGVAKESWAEATVTPATGDSPGRRTGMTARLPHPCGIPHERWGHRAGSESVSQRRTEEPGHQGHRGLFPVTCWKPQDPDPEGPGSSGRSGDKRGPGQGRQFPLLQTQIPGGKCLQKTMTSEPCSVGHTTASWPQMPLLRLVLESWHFWVCLVPQF